MDLDKFKTRLAYIIVFAIIICLIFLFGGITVIERDILNIIIGALLMRLSDVYGYYFGSSSGSDEKTKLLAKFTS